MDSLYREVMVVKNGELRPCTVGGTVVASGSVEGSQGRHAWHPTKQLSLLRHPGALQT